VGVSQRRVTHTTRSTHSSSTTHLQSGHLGTARVLLSSWTVWVSEMPSICKRAPLVALGLLIGAFLGTFSIPTVGQQDGVSLLPQSSDAQRGDGRTRHDGRLQMFSSSDGVFQFEYSDLLVRCTEKQGYWDPVDSCSAISPMCDNQLSAESRTVVCIAYPKNRLENRPAFQGGTFSVAEIKDATTSTDCLNFPRDEYFDAHSNRTTRILNGASFEQFDFPEGAMNQFLDRQVYRNFHEGKCYELSVKIVTASPGVLVSSRGKKFSKRDSRKVRNRIEQPLYSFKYLK
jgi:hypothetical protein